MSTPTKSDVEAREVEDVPHHNASNFIGILDLADDPHRAALEDDPDKAELPSWSTLLAVLVSPPHPATGLQKLTGASS
jgi:hypothetical protein